jgi:hypothetical protein
MIDVCRNSAITLDKLEELLSPNPNDGGGPVDKGDNLEHDLHSTPWMVKKIRNSERYAQNLYAALCNNEFIKLNFDDTVDNIYRILSDDLNPWSCSWRYAGGIIADIRGTGDYLDWYCSSMTSNENNDQISEGVVTSEVEADLLSIGWRVVDSGHDL